LVPKVSTLTQILALEYVSSAVGLICLWGSNNVAFTGLSFALTLVILFKSVFLDKLLKALKESPGSSQLSGQKVDEPGKAVSPSSGVSPAPG
jgi:uncharacterized membrane protein YhiD involved in acid resistance